MSEKWSVHAAMSPVDIGLVMERREVIGRKFEDRDVFRELREIAYRYVNAYTGDFEWVVTQRDKYEQYGRLFDRAVAGVLNCLYKDVEQELQQGAREEKRAAAVPSPQRKMDAPVGDAETIPDGTYIARGTDGKEYTILVRAGRVMLQGKKKRMKLALGARPIHDDGLFSDADMEGLPV